MMALTKKRFWMMTLASIVIAISVIGIVILLLVDMCGNETFETMLSPDGVRKAVIFQRDCGATTDFSTQISIIGGADDLVNESGNIYIVAGHPKESAPVISWQGNDVLIIHRDLDGSEFNAVTVLKGDGRVKVVYAVAPQLAA
ncbi:DUF5412 family protein [Endozoicomonas sp.]|uniref:DUF5412 family protein n=1 Tax=Endozoicomonas sp. TaxID=1892382 RepID=UPI003AF7524E